jgi:hypothetical protein
MRTQREKEYTKKEKIKERKEKKKERKKHDMREWNWLYVAQNKNKWGRGY